MNKWLTLLCSLFFVTTVSAAVPKPTSAPDSKEQLQALLSQMQSFAGEFSQSVVDFEGQVLQQTEGKILIQQPDKLYWEAFEPNENTLIADGETLWHIDPFVEQVVAIRQEDAISSNPLILLSTTDPNVWQQYDVLQTKAGYEIRSLAPEGQIEKLVLVFKEDRLREMTLIDRQKQATTLTFRNSKQNEKLDQSWFKFTLPEGYDLDDQTGQ